jgi:hypothetical protein
MSFISPKRRRFTPSEFVYFCKQMIEKTLPPWLRSINIRVVLAGQLMSGWGWPPHCQLSFEVVTSADRDSNGRTCAVIPGVVTVTCSAHFCRALPRYRCAAPLSGVSRDSNSAEQQAKIDRCATVFMPVIMIRFLSDR